jgi:hypothetical protein
LFHDLRDLGQGGGRDWLAINFFADGAIDVRIWAFAHGFLIVMISAPFRRGDLFCGERTT